VRRKSADETRSATAAHKNGLGAVGQAARIGTPAGWGRGGLRQPRVLALGYEVGAFNYDLSWPWAGAWAAVLRTASAS
jgi:hypothetical protein